MQGFEANLVLRPTSPDEPYVVLSFWDSQENFEAWTQSDAFRKGHARSGSLPKEAFTAPSVLEVHEVFLDTREG
jgi:heme-degrading monooxygenase HmoA